MFRTPYDVPLLRKPAVAARSGERGHPVCPQRDLPPRDVCEKFGWSSHVWIPCANGMLLRCFGNNNISVLIMSYFIKCWVAKVLEQLLCLCRMLNTQSDHLFSIWGKTCPSTFLNTLKLLLVCLKQHMKVLLLSNILSYSGLRSLPKSSRSESSVIQVCIFKTYYRHRENFIWILLQQISFVSQMLIL